MVHPDVHLQWARSMNPSPATRSIRFGPFHLDPRTRELRKGPTRVRVPEQSVRILLALLERSGDVVTRDELVALLWPGETDVDIEHGLNSAVRRLRDALGDSAERPVFVETVPRVGYRFVGPVDKPAPVVPAAQAAAEGTKGTSDVTNPDAAGAPASVAAESRPWWRLLAAAVLVVAAVASILMWRGKVREGTATAFHAEPIPLTFEGGLQTDPSISSDGQWIAYSSDDGGNFEIWVRRLSGGDPVQVTHDQAPDHQPDWSPDGSRLVFRSERADGGLFVAPVTGGTTERISTSGFRPRWSPDGRRILFAERVVTGLNLGLRVLDLQGGATHSWPGSAVGAFGWQASSSTVLSLASLFGPFEPTLVSWTVGAASVDAWAIAAEVTRDFRAQQLVVVGGEEVTASGNSALYFVGASRGKRAVWRLDIDPGARRVVAGPHRVTTLLDANNASLSLDGARVVFDGGAPNAQIVSYALGRDGRPVGEPVGITSEAAHAASPTLSRDGNAFAFVLTRPGSPERSEFTARFGGEARHHTIRVIDHPREVVGMARWDDKGTKLAYSFVSNADAPSALQQLRLFDRSTGADVPLTSPHSPMDVIEFPAGWTPDGRHVIVTSWNYATSVKAIARVPIDAAPAAERAAQIIIRSTDVGISLGTMSPNGRWVAFRVGEMAGMAPRIAVVSADAGSSANWTFLTRGVEPADKPCWSDDGTMLYFTSGNETLNVLGVRFDAASGRSIGEPFRITNFSGPGAHIYSDLRTLELGVGGGRLIVPVVRPKGSLWMLDLKQR